MPPHLHPRSVMTTSLFTTTLAISFLVVGLPHIMPCPVDPRQRTDGPMEMVVVDENGRRRRLRRKIPVKAEEPLPSPETEEMSEQEAEVMRARGRECPLPKPGGIIGQVLGFKNEDRTRPVIKVEPARPRAPRTQE